MYIFIFFPEIPDLIDPIQFKLLKDWNGELRFIQNFKLKRFSELINKKITYTSNKQQTSPLNMIIDN